MSRGAARTRVGALAAALVLAGGAAAQPAPDVWNERGVDAAAEGRSRAALSDFGRAVAEARASGDRLALVRALANRARAALEADPAADVAADLDEATEALQAAPELPEAATLLLNIGRSYERAHRATGDAALLLRAHGVYREALRRAGEDGDARATAYALGWLGSLYARDGRLDDALVLSRRALVAAEAPVARDTQYLWHARIGALQARRGDPEGARAAYRAALSELERLRPAAADDYGPTGRRFRIERRRIHLEAVELWLAELEGGLAPDAEQARLREVLRFVERRQADALRNYFQDDCVDAVRARRTGAAQVSPSARIVYPLLLERGLVLLVAGPERIERHVVGVPSAEVAEGARELRRRVTDVLSFGFRKSARRLHDWLIAPLEPGLAAAGVETLVFVLDGPLRAVPMAALYDGERYLAERYALALVPSLSLVDPRPFARAGARVFLGGVSESVQGFPALPHVRAEIASIGELYDAAVRLDERFTRQGLASDLAGQDFSVVHVATHAKFAGRSRDTFLLTYDGRLSLDQFADEIGRFRFREQPLELLTLSACETARGDDRAALGLAGLAVKAGARSAVATLWQVNDAAAARVTTRVYRELRAPGVTRAEALRRAQRALLEDRRYRHPAYWSAFLLIGNWL